MAQVTLRGNPVQVEGDLPQVGAQAPDFTLTAGDGQAVAERLFNFVDDFLAIAPGALCQ